MYFLSDLAWQLRQYSEHAAGHSVKMQEAHFCIEGAFQAGIARAQRKCSSPCSLAFQKSKTVRHHYFLNDETLPPQPKLLKSNSLRPQRWHALQNRHFGELHQHHLANHLHCDLVRLVNGRTAGTLHSQSNCGHLYWQMRSVLLLPRWSEVASTSKNSQRQGFAEGNDIK